MEIEELVIYRRESDGWIGFTIAEDWELFVNANRTELCRVTNLREAMRLCTLANTKEE